MKKTLLSGLLACTLLASTAGAASAADLTTAPETELAKGVTISASSSLTAESNGSINFRTSDLKAYTAETYRLEVEQTKTLLNRMITDKQMTQQEADAILSAMQAELQQIEAGTLTLYYADILDENGNVVGKVASCADPANMVVDADNIDTINTPVVSGAATVSVYTADAQSCTAVKAVNATKAQK